MPVPLAPLVRVLPAMLRMPLVPEILPFNSMPDPKLFCAESFRVLAFKLMVAVLDSVSLALAPARLSMPELAVRVMGPDKVLLPNRPRMVPPASSVVQAL